MSLSGYGRERVFASIRHGKEELRLCLVRNMRGNPELLELRHWTLRPDLDAMGPTSHGIQFPTTLIPWLIEKLQGIDAPAPATAPRDSFEQKFEKDMAGDGEI